LALARTLARTAQAHWEKNVTFFTSSTERSYKSVTTLSTSQLSTLSSHITEVLALFQLANTRKTTLQSDKGSDKGHQLLQADFSRDLFLA
jgi:hypothetical protein